MATDIKLDESQVTIEAFTFKVEGADLKLDSTERRSGAGGEHRRALVHGPGDALVLNWAGDYTGGVYLNGRTFALGDVAVNTGKWPSNVRAADGRIEPLAVTPTAIEMVPVGEELTRLRGELAVIRELVETLKVHASIRADAPHYTQSDWRWCERCSNLSFGPNVVRSVCPVDKKPHVITRSGVYTLFPQRSRYPGQSGWGWCNKCQGLCHGSAAQSGFCPAGGAHDRTDSPDYILMSVDSPPGTAARDFPTQDNWRWCNRCYSLFHAGTPGTCPAPGGGPHNPSGSSNYLLQC